MAGFVTRIWHAKIIGLPVVLLQICLVAEEGVGLRWHTDSTQLVENAMRSKRRKFLTSGSIARNPAQGHRRTSALTIFQRNETRQTNAANARATISAPPIQLSTSTSMAFSCNTFYF